jgi:hypothetical protein
MPHKGSRDEEAQGLLGWLYERGEDAVGQVLDELVSSRDVAHRVGKTVGRATDAKHRLDRNMQFLLSVLNLPSRSDYNKLLAKVEALQGSLVNVNIKLDRLLAAQAASSLRRPAGTKRAPQKPEPGES